jgi:UDPglucose 6-dehydrogenase
VSGRTAFLGLSHLGIVSSAGWASFGQPTLGLDPDRSLVADLQARQLPVHEPGLPELIERCGHDLTYSDDLTDLQDCPLVVVSRDIPTDENDASDVGPVLRLIDSAIPNLRQDVVLVIMCQVSPGFTRELGNRIESLRPDLRFQLYYWVETLIFGNAVQRTLEPERFMVGCDDPSDPLAAVFLRGLERYGCPIMPMRYESAELTKTAINLYLIGSVTYANTLSDLCEAIGADWSEMVPALKLDKRIGPAAYLRPSLGVAGGNLERDLATLRSLTQQFGVDSIYLDALDTFNKRRFNWVWRKLETNVFAATSRPKVGVWGLTYKKDTRSTKNSPALRLLPDLTQRADVRAWDPAIGSAEVATSATIVANRDDVLDNADALVVMADWDHFGLADLDAVRRAMRRPVIIDSVGVLQHRRSEMEGIEYVGMGR